MSADTKAIVLFSDGTGNSSAKLFKTNVWRMYEAVDLGPPAPDRRQQIAYYDDGVGTSSFKPLAVLGGVFGHGLKRNVLDIYKYACRNYKPGDDLYAFGFSRGAFTIRLAVALIASEGLVQSEDESELDRQARCAYRAFRRLWLPRRLEWPTKACRRIRDAFIRTPYDRKRNLTPPIQFIGVWDTVSAYGGPIAELTRAIDNWIFRLSTPDYELNPAVKCARHALALDDERDAFHPLLWDEVYEDKVEADALKENPTARRRMQQVWFTGMHSDVGGGYPDESLSYVSLLWMMEEAEKAGLNTITVIKDRFFALASSAGPIHDSRTGAAGYYRYQPRKIAAWLNPVDDRTAGIRDPAIVDNDSRQQKGLLMSVKVHESVIHRISCGTDRYAPTTLPERFTIVPPQVEGENKPQADSVDEAVGAASERGHVAVATRSQRLVSQALRDRLEDKDVQKARAAAFEAVWDLVWHRRVAYFITVAFTLFLVTMPIWISSVSNGGSSRTAARGSTRRSALSARCCPRWSRSGSTPSRTIRSTRPCWPPASGSRCATARPRNGSCAMSPARSGRRPPISRVPCLSLPERAAWRGSAMRPTTSAGCRCSSGGSSRTTPSCPSSSSWPGGSAPEA